MSPLRYVLSLIGVSLLLPCVGSRAFAQSVLSEPDFSGMFTPQGYVESVTRDSRRGWNYVGGPFVSHLNGVSTAGAISRVNDSGFIDQNWRSTANFESESLGEMMVTSAGVLLAQKGGRWHRMVRGEEGSFAPVPLNAELYGLTAGADGYIYGVQNSYQYNAPSVSIVRRLLPSGEFDFDWSMRIESFSSGVQSIAVAANGDVAYIEGFFTSALKPYTIGRRQSSSTVALWTHSVAGAPTAITMDDVGRTYVIGDGLVIDGHAGDVLRLLPTGEVDTSWSTPLDMSPSNIVSARVSQGRLVVVGFLLNADEWMPSVATVSATTGAVESRAALDGISSGESFNLASDGSVLTTSGRAVSLHKVRSADGAYESRVLLSDLGSPASLAKVMRWRDGYVLAGSFRYWHEGVQYNTLMRLDGALKPDPTWRPDVSSVQNGGKVVSALAVDSRGGLVVGGSFNLGPRRNLVRFTAGGALDETWSPNPDGDVTQLHAADDGLMFVTGWFTEIGGVPARAIARFGADGALDAQWTPGLSSITGRLGIYQLVDLGNAGVFVDWFVSNFENSFGGWARVARTGSGTELPSLLTAGPDESLSFLPEPLSGQLFALQTVREDGLTGVVVRNTLTRRIRSTLAVDPTWPSLALPGYLSIGGVDATHIYVSSYQVGTKRVSMASGALEEAWGLPQLRIYSVASADDSSKMLVLSYGANSTRAYLIDKTTRANSPREVIEYLARGNGHFFMTARPAEQRLLDSLPADFTRTGMQFSADDGAVQGMTPSALKPSPICRFYASPARGGSSTHFYGRQTDCQLLNTVGGLDSEGYDFATPLQVGDRCPANAPIPSTACTTTSPQATTAITVTLFLWRG